MFGFCPDTIPNYVNLLLNSFLKMYRPAVRNSLRQLTVTAHPAAIRGYAAHATPQPFDWQDPLNSKSLLTEEEIAISETAEAYCQERMLPRVLRRFNCQVTVHY
jgi:glutaryl-CoA dehydrogenase